MTALSVAADVALALSIAGMAYVAIALVRVWSFGRRRAEFERVSLSKRSPGESQGGAHALPAVTILKPLAGVEPGLRENLRSFCVQDYPQFQVVFGVRDGADPGAAIVRDVIAELPGADLSLVTGADTSVPNAKVATLLNMQNACKHEILIVADSDTHVTSDYLRAVVAALRDSDVGAVTCVYRGRPQGGVASDLGAMMIEDQFIPSVLVAALGRIRFCLGATMAVRKQTLTSIGGFAALGSYLADDQRLGEMVAATGAHVALAPYVMDHDVNEPGLKDLWEHEVRWARTSRLARPWGYAGYVITYPLILALVYVALSQNIVAGALVVLAALALRLALHYEARTAFRVRSHDKPWLIPLRDLLGIVEWGASLFGRSVRWRGQWLTVDGAGRIVPST